MSIETILTDEKIKEIFEWHIDDPEVEALSFDFARDIEHAILQSDEIQRLRGIEAQAERIVIRCGEDGNYLVLTADLDRLRAAMEQKK